MKSFNKHLYKYLILLTLLSCGVEYKNNRHVVDPAFWDYYTSFENEIGLNPWQVSASFFDSNGDIAGMCYMGEAKIVIDREHWENATVITKEIIIYHELGHCLENRGHNTKICHDKDTNIDYPCSIMYPIVINDYFFILFHDKYIKDMKGL